MNRRAKASLLLGVAVSTLGVEYDELRDGSHYRLPSLATLKSRPFAPGHSTGSIAGSELEVSQISYGLPPDGVESDYDSTMWAGSNFVVSGTASISSGSLAISTLSGLQYHPAQGWWNYIPANRGI